MGTSLTTTLRNKSQMGFSLTGIIFLAAVSWASLGLAAQGETEPQIDTFTLAMQLFGGLSLFLFGIDYMSDGLKSMAGNRMAGLLGSMTRNRFLGGLTGAFVTAILNSSSVTTVLVVGFTTAGIMTLQQSIGVIMGANIGSTMTAQIVAFNVTQYAMLPITIGFGMTFFGKTEGTRHSGAMLFGLGLLFGGMGIMSEAMYPLRSYPPFLDLMSQMENPLLGILVGAGFTALVQSSAATTGIAIVMAAEGLLSLPAGIALALGANIGTCATAVLAAIGKPVEAKRAAGAHVMFNVLGVIIWLPFIGLLAQLATAASPVHPELAGAARMAEEVPRQIANAHTIFNVVNTMIFIWFTGFFARTVERVLPERLEAMKEIITAKFLDEALLGTPGLALEAARFEIQRLAGITLEMMQRIGPALRSGEKRELEEIAELDGQVDVLNGKIMAYLTDIYQQELTEEQSTRVMQKMRGTDEVQRISSVIRNDLIAVGHQILDTDVVFSETTDHALTELYDQTCAAVVLAVDAIADRNEAKALQVVQMKPTINRLIDDALAFQQQRVSPADPGLIDQFRIEDEIIDALKRVYSLTKRIANLILPDEVSDREDG